MTSMRNRMHVVLWALLAMFLLSMTVGGLVGGANIIDQLLGRVNPNTTIARINGHDISPDRFNMLVTQELNQIRTSGQTVNDFHLNRARNTAWDNLIQDILVTQEVERLGLFATDDEVLYHLENNPPQFLQQNVEFQTDGKFDRDKYMSLLSSPQGDEWAPIELFMKNTYIPNFKLQQYLDQSIVVSNREIEKEFMIQNISYTINALHITNASVSQENIIPTNLELEEEYNNSKENFELNEQRAVKYCLWEKEPSKSDSLSVKLLAESLVERAKDGEDFSSLANEYTNDPGNAGDKGGDLGWFKKGSMVKPFEDAAFKAKTGEVLGPILSNFGYHVIHVRQKRSAVNKEDEVLASHILLKIETSATTLNTLKRNATLFSYDAQDFGFEKAADSNNIDISTYSNLDENSISIPKLGAIRSAVQFAFRSNVGDVSSILENDRFFAVFSLENITPPRISPFEDVIEQLKNKVQMKKLKVATLDKANAMLIDITSENKSLNEFEKLDANIEVILNETKTLSQGFKSINKSNYVIGALLSANKGELLGPLETNRGHAIVELLEQSKMDTADFQIKKDVIQNNIYNQKQNQIFQSWISGLKNKAEIIDNRKFYF